MAFLGVVVLLGLLIAWQREARAPTPAGRTATAPRPTRGETTDALTARAEPASARPDSGNHAAPDERFVGGTPLVDMQDALRAQADAGNAAAGCRLGTELGRCAGVFEQRGALDRDIATAARMTPGSAQEREATRRIAADTAALAPFEAICRGVTGEQARTGWRPLHRAAMAGHLPSMEAFAIHPPLSETNFTADLDGWKVFRESAMPLLEAAARRGSPRAHNQLAWVYGNLPVAGGSPLAPRDLVRAIAHATVARDAATPASRRQLERLIAKWQREAGADAARQAASMAAELRTSLVLPAGEGIDFTNDQVRQPEDCEG